MIVLHRGNVRSIGLKFNKAIEDNMNVVVMLYKTSIPTEHVFSTADGTVERAGGGMFFVNIPLDTVEQLVGKYTFEAKLYTEKSVITGTNTLDVYIVDGKIYKKK